jgi:hypothetical protein
LSFAATGHYLQTDPGTHADASTTVDRVISGFIAVMGIFFFASVLGFVVDFVREVMDTLNKVGVCV